MSITHITFCRIAFSSGHHSESMPSLSSYSSWDLKAHESLLACEARGSWQGQLISFDTSTYICRHCTEYCSRSRRDVAGVTTWSLLLSNSNFMDLPEAWLVCGCANFAFSAAPCSPANLQMQSNVVSSINVTLVVSKWKHRHGRNVTVRAKYFCIGLSSVTAG